MQVTENSTGDDIYTWVPAHYQIADWLASFEHRQQELISQLKDMGVTGFNDKDENDHPIQLSEIDPFTFYCYIYKYGPEKRLKLLQDLCKSLNISPIPKDEKGIPSTNAMKVWLFPYKRDRQNGEIEKLWNFFKSARINHISNEEFANILKIRSIGKAKLTEALFNIDPKNNLPINAQTRPYLKERFDINPQFDDYTGYKKMLDSLRSKTDEPFYQVSFEAYDWNQENNQLEEDEEKYEIEPGRKLRSYWLYAPGENADHWEEFYSKGIMGVGWQNLGDLKKYISKDAIANKLAETDPQGAGRTNVINACYEFVNQISPGDIVFVKKGVSALMGYGIVTSDCYFDNDRLDYKNCRKVDWKKKGQWPSEHRLAIKTLTEITDDEELIEYLTHLFDIEKSTQSEFMGAKNIILYGPPGTGKTYSTIDKAVEIIRGKSFGTHQQNKEEFDKIKKEGLIEFVTFHQNYSYEDFMLGIKPDLSESTLKFVKQEGIFYRICKQAENNYLQAGKKIQNLKPFKEVFEEFLRPLEENSEEIEVRMLSGNTSFWITDINPYNLSFRKQSGGTAHTLSFETLEDLYYNRREFKSGLQIYYQPIINKLWASGRINVSEVELKKYVLIIDEINRGNISKIFGELITLLEDDKRLGGTNELRITIPNSEVPFGIPPNLFIIGTMNTADKSIALVDIALRRRFDFIGKYPIYEGYEAADLLRKINEQIYVERKSPDYLIGHGYFMSNQPIPDILKLKVVPLLMEYFSGKPEVVSRIFANTDWKVFYDTSIFEWEVSKK
ncbi:MAG TPA: AAA family ATPase [Chitinophagaceae bacterium]|nr:AAA family ATPase [Chitinophagaceae bacterium]